MMLNSYPMNWWGKVITVLLDRKGWSKNQLERAGIITRSQVNRAYKGPYGPSVVVLERILFGIGASWHDWAEAYDEAKRQHRHAFENPMAAEERSTYSASVERRESKPIQRGHPQKNKGRATG